MFEKNLKIMYVEFAGPTRFPGCYGWIECKNYDIVGIMIYIYTRDLDPPFSCFVCKHTEIVEVLSIK